MNRSQFVESLKSVVASKKFSDFDESKTDSVVRTFFASICEALLEGRKVELRGFGTFELRNYKGYNGINPKTKKPIQSKAKKIPFFKAGKDLVSFDNEE